MAPDIGTYQGDAAPSLLIAAASALLESAARGRGLQVRRLDDELVVCSDGSRRVLFRGLAGNRSGRLSHTLCSNDAWLRSYLARRGLPVVPTRLAGLGDADLALRAAESLGFPVRIRLANGSAEAGEHVTTDVASFQAAWVALGSRARSLRASAVLDVFLPTPTIEIAIVGGDAVATTPSIPDGPMDVVTLARRAVAVLPDGVYGAVRVTAGPTGTLIDAVDLSLPGRAGPSASKAIAEAVMSLELPGVC